MGCSGKHWHWQQWTLDELLALHKFFSEATEEQLLALLPNRHLPAIRAKAYSIGLKRSKVQVSERRRERAKAMKLHLIGRENLWNEEEIELFKGNYPNKTIYQLLNLFPQRTRSSFEHMAHKLQLTKTEAYREQRRLRDRENLKKTRDNRDNRWSKLEVRIISEKYPNSPREEICQLLPKRSWNAITHQAHRIGLRRTDEIRYKVFKTGEINPASWTHKKPTKVEQRIGDIMHAFHLEYTYVGDGSLRIFNLNPDFIESNGQKKLIEVFGRVFHDPNKTFKRKIPLSQQERYRKALYASLGFDCLVLWDDEMARLSGHEIADRIKKFTNSKQKPTAQLKLSHA